jgi:hypothetical protein
MATAASKGDALSGLLTKHGGGFHRRDPRQVLAALRVLLSSN